MSDEHRQNVYAIGKKNPNLPFHPAVRAGDFIFVSGQVAKDADGNMLSGTIEQETAGTIESIRRIPSARSIRRAPGRCRWAIRSMRSSSGPLRRRL